MNAMQLDTHCRHPCSVKRREPVSASRTTPIHRLPTSQALSVRFLISRVSACGLIEASMGVVTLEGPARGWTEQAVWMNEENKRAMELRARLQHEAFPLPGHDLHLGPARAPFCVSPCPSCVLHLLCMIQLPQQHRLSLAAVCSAEAMFAHNCRSPCAPISAMKWIRRRPRSYLSPWAPRTGLQDMSLIYDDSAVVTSCACMQIRSREVLYVVG